MINIVNITPIEALGVSWLLIGFEHQNINMGDAMHLALLHKKNYKPSHNLRTDIRKFFSGKCKVPILRIHSECILGDALRSDLCDCGEQLNFSIRSIVEHGSGIVLYMRQEGRGIGLRAKLACLAAQEGYINGVKKTHNMTPDEANIFYGYRVDERSYDIVSDVLMLFGISKVTMLTSNLDKISAVESIGIKVKSIADINRNDISKESRKYRELSEKASRNYCLGILP